MRTNTSEKSGARREALDFRLSGYSAGAKVAAAARRLRSRTGNWPVYAAAAGSALAMTTSASASIISGVYTGTGPNGGVRCFQHQRGFSHVCCAQQHHHSSLRCQQLHSLGIGQGSSRWFAHGDEENFGRTSYINSQEKIVFERPVALP